MEAQETSRPTQGGNGDWPAQEATEEAGILSDLPMIDRRIREVIRERPILAVATAVAAGFVLGRLLSRI